MVSGQLVGQLLVSAGSIRPVVRLRLVRRLLRVSGRLKKLAVDLGQLLQSRCDVGLHGRKYDGPTTKSILFIYVRTHRVTFCEKASFRQLALVLLSGDVALNPGPLKFGFANCRSIRNKGPILCDEIQTGNFDVFGLTETHIKALDTPSFLNELTPEDFSLVHSNRENKRGGGVGFFIKSALDFKTIHSPEFSSF